MKKRLKRNKGFSLVELSIVIIILGLIITSVLVGKDLIKAAEIRGLISQLDTYNAAVSTFRLKYVALPGDISNANRRGLGANNGDGDGFLEDDTDGGDPDNADYELIYFWDHLSRAGYINGRYDGDDTNGAIGETFPEAKTGGGITVYTIDGINYYHIGISNAISGSPKPIKFINAFVPEDAFAVDNKIDDALPLRGIVIARSASCSSNSDRYSCANTAITTATGGASQTAGTTCVLQAGSAQDLDLDEYDFETTGLKCNLRIEMKQ